MVQQTAQFPEYTWLHMAESLALNAELNPSNRKWDAVLKANKERGQTALNNRLATLLTVDVMLLSRCNVFVGKHTSNFFRTAYELHAARCDCAPPFVSLDAPWCFDYGLTEGRNWDFPFGENTTGLQC